MDVVTTLDLEDLTPRQLRKMLHGIASSRLPTHKKSDKDKAKDSEKAEDENSSLVDLDREKGDSKPPKVLKSDMPDKEKKEEDEDEEGED